MSDSLKDQLLKLGFKSTPSRPPHSGKSESSANKSGAKPSDRNRHGGKPNGNAHANAKRGERRHGDGRKPATQEEIDLAKAYAIRAQKEKEERIAEEKRKQEEARIRRENKAKLVELLAKSSLNVPEAELPRHFPYGDKIRRVYVTAEQLRALNAGELAVVQHGGRYHVVSLETADAAVALYPGCLALRVDPNAPPDDTDYSDPKYQVPDDLIW